MASSPPHYTLTSKRLESLSTKQKSAPGGDLDDTRSSTSMSSNTKASVCRICKGPERLVSPLIACVVCKSRYHRSCPNPTIEKQLAEYTCGRCVEKKAKQANAAITSIHNRVTGTQDPVKLQESTATRKMTRLQMGVETQDTNDRVSPPHRSVSIILCEGKDNDGKPCPKPARSGKAENLCFMCALMAKHKKTRETPMPAPVAAQRPPINKKKLHTLRKEDRPLVTKRKRASLGNGYASRTTRHEEVTASKSSEAKPYSDKKKPVNSFRLPVQDPPNIIGHSVAATLFRSPSQDLPDTETVNGTLLPVPSAGDSSIQRPSQIVNASEIARPQSVGSKLHEGLFPTDVVLEKISEISDDALHNGIVYPEKPSQDSQFDVPKSEGRKKGALSKSTQDNPPFDNSSPEPPSPMSDASSYNIPSPQLPDFETLEQRDDVSMKSTTDEASVTSYVKSDQAGEYDGSILDSFLLQQAQRDPIYEPTSTELLDTQNWSAGDPRPFWPKRITAAQKAEKMVEIAARGGRKAKANFGNVLRPQLVQERLARGWDVHQSREKRTDLEALEAVQNLSELFGFAEGELGNCVPRSVDGKLVMQDTRESQPKWLGPGRQKKEAPLGVYPVHGGQLQVINEGGAR
ncbi:hypothetical protein VTL71DRAFT_11147 [Oculimacula yallundae]|uniref:PHD-type domain-containing protein n=1 Tax=Oculimacula yallundae TaxID=86028 RepID=A0ABR4CWK1_9HELO